MTGCGKYGEVLRGACPSEMRAVEYIVTEPDNNSAPDFGPDVMDLAEKRKGIEWSGCGGRSSGSQAVTVMGR